MKGNWVKRSDSKDRDDHEVTKEVEEEEVDYSNGRGESNVSLEEEADRLQLRKCLKGFNLIW